jgi:hypothetical protein
MTTSVKLFGVITVGTVLAITMSGCSIADIVAAGTSSSTSSSTATSTASSTAPSTPAPAAPEITIPPCVYGLNFNDPCAAKKRFTAIVEAPLTLPNAQRDFLDAYLPMATDENPLSTQQLALRSEIEEVYGEINSGNMGCYKILALKQLDVSAEWDKGLSSLNSFNTILLLAPDEPVEKLIDYLNDRLDKTVGYDWDAVWQTTEDDVMPGDIQANALLCN